MQTSFHKLSNGLTVIHLHTPGSPVAHFGVAVRAGSSNELTDKESGLAHFVEHTLFKGTNKRSSWHIINRMESVGGELNAFTTKEDTVIYSTFPKGSLLRAIELITDLILNSRFPVHEIDKEREVICDEINSYLDSPSDAVYDEFEDILYEGTPLGHNILGTVESVRSISDSMCREWLKRHYHASNMVAFYAGSMSLPVFLKKTAPYLSTIPCGKVPTENKAPFHVVKPFSLTKNNDTHQAHTVMGCALPKLDLEQRMTLALITNILGGPGMNSLLNVALRERYGLVYSVESNMSNWNSSTMFTTYFGTDPEDDGRCKELVNETIKKLTSGYITKRRLMGAKKQYLGQLILARQNVESRIISMARAFLLHGRILTMDETESLLEKITPEMIIEMAGRIESLSSLTLMKTD